MFQELLIPTTKFLIRHTKRLLDYSYDNLVEDYLKRYYYIYFEI